MVRNYQLLYTTMVGGHIPSLKLTAKTPENGWWKINFLLGRPIFRGDVSFRELSSSNAV